MKVGFSEMHMQFWQPINCYLLLHLYSRSLRTAELELDQKPCQICLLVEKKLMSSGVVNFSLPGVCIGKKNSVHAFLIDLQKLSNMPVFYP
jgi:hypothetical protein